MTSFSEAKEAFLRHLEDVKQSSTHTIRNYETDLRSFREFIETDRKIQSLSRKDIQLYIASLHGKIQKKSVARKLAALRSLFRFSIQKGWIQNSPMEDIGNPKIEKKIPNPLNYEQVEHLLNQPEVDQFLGYRDRCMMELLYSSALRVSELVGLNRSDFDKSELLLRVRGKGKKERIVPITQNAADWIHGYLYHIERHQKVDGHEAEQDTEAVFLNRFGKRLTTRSVDRLFHQYLRASGLVGTITPHTIRHTIATHWLESGMDLKMIQTLLGHRSLTATTIYTQVSPKLKKEVYDKAHPRA